MIDVGANGPTQAGPWQSVRALWRRAQAWRLVVLTAGLLTGVFLFYPPSGSKKDPIAAVPDQNRPASADTASYIAPADALRSPVTVEAPPGTPARAATLSMVRAAPRRKDATGLDEAMIGSLYTKAVTVDGYEVPLPQGEWASLAHSTISLPTATGDAHFLGRIRNKRLIGAVRIFAARSKSQPGAGFPEVKSCAEVNPGRTYVAIDGEMVTNGHQACWTIRTVYATPWQRWADKSVKISNLDRAAAGDMTAKGVSYPQDFIALTFSRTEKWGLLEVMYLFSPETDDIVSHTALSVGETDWTPANIDRYPDKVAYVGRLKAWGVTFWPLFKRSFDRGGPPSNN